MKTEFLSLKSGVESLSDWEQPFRQSLSNKSKNTIQSYALDIGKFSRWYLAECGQAFIPQLLTSVDMKAYRAHSLEVEAVAASTWNRRLVSLRALAAWALGVGLLDYDPTEGIQEKDQQRARPRWLAVPEQRKVERVLERAIHASVEQPARYREAIRNRAMVLAMLKAGLRVGEVVQLSWEDVEINPRSGWIKVRCGKGDKYRRVPIGMDLRAALAKWQDACPGSSLVFEVTSRTIQRVVEMIGWNSQIEGKLTPHVLRHCFCRRLAEAGERLEVIADLAGHSKLETTRRYVMPGEADLMNAVERL